MSATKLDLAALEGKITKKGTAVDNTTLKSNELIGVYFSAHWCPPCRGFTPALAEFYTKVLAAGKKIEIIFVSSDRDDASFKEYYDSMPWAALDFGDRELKQKLCEDFGIRGIPTLILFDSEGNVITQDGRSKVMQDPEGAGFPYK